MLHILINQNHAARSTNSSRNISRAPQKVMKKKVRFLLTNKLIKCKYGCKANTQAKMFPIPLRSSNNCKSHKALNNRPIDHSCLPFLQSISAAAIICEYLTRTFACSTCVLCVCIIFFTSVLTLNMDSIDTAAVCRHQNLHRDDSTLLAAYVVTGGAVILAALSHSSTLQEQVGGAVKQ